MNDTLIAAIITAIATAGLALLAVFQMRAMGLQAVIAREAAEHSVQPRVTPHFWVDPVPRVLALPSADEPERGESIEEPPVTIRYYLSNDGLGPAFAITHYICVSDRDHWNRKVLASLAPGGHAPYSAGGQPGKYFELTLPRSAFADKGIRYFVAAVFENVMGDKFEVRTRPGPQQTPTFRRLTPR